MHTIEEILVERLMQTPFLADALEQGLINTTALAREWQPWLSEEAYKDVSVAAISMALRRLMERKKVKPDPRSKKFPVRKLLLQPNLHEVVLKRSDNVDRIYHKLRQQQKKLRDENLFLHVSQGLQETMIIISNVLREPLSAMIEGETILRDSGNLSAVSLLFPSGTEEVPGIFYQFFRALAWENISVVEVLSIWSELTFIVQRKDAERALSVLQKISH